MGQVHDSCFFVVGHDVFARPPFWVLILGEYFPGKVSWNKHTSVSWSSSSAPERAKRVKPSLRGELEITSLLENYLADGTLRVKKMGRGYAWLDTGTHASLLEASEFVYTLQKRQGLQTGRPDEIAYHKGWISAADLAARSQLFGKNEYGQYLRAIIKGG